MKELPKRSNGYEVVAACENCGGLLCLLKNHKGKPYLAHINRIATGTNERTCYQEPKYAKADRMVPELGLFQ
jgi:hypothetical protein